MPERTGHNPNETEDESEYIEQQQQKNGRTKYTKATNFGFG